MEAGPSDDSYVLLLYRFLTSSQILQKLVPELADEFHVIAPDYLDMIKLLK
ncbi:MAG: hypothetical protein HKM23_06665 [Nitrosopumilus sp.]|nr:hypothetical protein [Nitrosopumilus sp.]